MQKGGHNHSTAAGGGGGGGPKPSASPGLSRAALGGSERVELFRWIRKGNFFKLRDLLSNSSTPAEVNVQNSKGQTPLYWACEKKMPEIVTLLVEKGADVNIEEQNGFTALMLASFLGHIDIVRVLINAGANVNHRNKASSTALHLAARNNHGQVVKTLLMKGADPSVQDDKGKLAWQYTDDSSIQNAIKDAMSRQGKEDGGDEDELLLPAKSAASLLAQMMDDSSASSPSSSPSSSSSFETLEEVVSQKDKREEATTIATQSSEQNEQSTKQIELFTNGKEQDEQNFEDDQQYQQQHQQELSPQSVNIRRSRLRDSPLRSSSRGNSNSMAGGSPTKRKHLTQSRVGIKFSSGGLREPLNEATEIELLRRTIQSLEEKLLIEEQRNLRIEALRASDASLCYHCKTALRDTALVPCMHFLYCWACCKRMEEDGVCHQCKTPVQGLIKCKVDVY
ncbi:AGC/RSK/RSK-UNCLASSIFIED protein kinase [Balamuthia mandrillaris]